MVELEVTELIWSRPYWPRQQSRPNQTPELEIGRPWSKIGRGSFSWGWNKPIVSSFGKWKNILVAQSIMVWIFAEMVTEQVLTDRKNKSEEWDMLQVKYSRCFLSYLDIYVIVRWSSSPWNQDFFLPVSTHLWMTHITSCVDGGYLRFLFCSVRCTHCGQDATDNDLTPPWEDNHTCSDKAQYTAWCNEIGSLTSLMHVNQLHPVTTENQFHCTRLYMGQ